jgi:hypothetical protein
MRCGIYRRADRGLIRVAVQEIPDTTPLAAIEDTAWRTFTRTNALPSGDFEVMKLGKGFHMEETRGFKSTDLGAVT